MPKQNDRRPVIANQFVLKADKKTQVLRDAQQLRQRAPRGSSSNSAQQTGTLPQQINVSQHAVVQNIYINNYYTSPENSTPNQQTFFGASGISSHTPSTQQSMQARSSITSTRPTVIASTESQRINISQLVNPQMVNEKTLDPLTLHTLTEAFQTPPRNPEETEMDTEMLLPKFW